MDAAREERIERAFFRGGSLSLKNRGYRSTVRRMLEALVQDDLAAGDLTSAALALEATRVRATVVARQAGVIAGLEEFGFLYRRHNIKVTFSKEDGDAIQPGDAVLSMQSDQRKLLGLERVGLNLLQRMSGIATAARRLHERVSESGSRTRIVGTRKTLWGMLDKRALHLGKAGTHRLGLSDAILIKNNHLAILARSEEEAVPLAVARAWKLRRKAAFIEVEVRSAGAAQIAAETFRRLRESAAEDYPGIVMLDNMSPSQARSTVEMLRQKGLWPHTLIEASGGIAESNLLEYAACGVDVISLGSLTHSARALDLHQRISATNSKERLDVNHSSAGRKRI